MVVYCGDGERKAIRILQSIKEVQMDNNNLNEYDGGNGNRGDGGNGNRGGGKNNNNKNQRPNG